jgi:outer membrane protein TolC
VLVRDRAIGRYSRLSLALAISLLWVPAEPGYAQAAAPELTLTEALKQAFATSPTLAAASQRVRQAQFGLIGAGALPEPQIDIGRGFGHGAAGTDEDIILAQTVELGGKLDLRRRQAVSELAAARAGEAQARAALTYQVKSAYYAAQEADAVAALNRELVDFSDQFQRAAQAQFEAGDVPRAQLLRSQIELATARQALLTAENDRYTRVAALNTLVGAEPGAPLRIEASAPFRPRSYDATALQQAARARPDLRAAEATLAARRAAARLVAAAGRPNLVAQAFHARVNEWPDGNTLRVSFVWPLFDTGRLRAERGAASAAAAEQEANVEALRRQVRMEVDTALHSLEQARALVETLTGGTLNVGGTLDRTRQLREMAQIGYQAGENSYLELLDAQRAYRTAATDVLRAMTAYDVAEAALEQAVGGQLPAPAPSAQLPPGKESLPMGAGRPAPVTESAVAAARGPAPGAGRSAAESARGPAPKTRLRRPPPPPPERSEGRVRRGLRSPGRPGAPAGGLLAGPRWGGLPVQGENARGA